MLHAVSWAEFFKALLVLAALYYFVIGLMFFRKELVGVLRRGKRPFMVMIPAVIMEKAAWAQTVDATNGINQANTMVRSYYDVAANLMYAVGGIMALMGAIRVYQHWNDSQHRQDAFAAAAGWFAACIFLVLAATVIKSFFGLQ
jgi:hypothetical protein